MRRLVTVLVLGLLALVNAVAEPPKIRKIHYSDYETRFTAKGNQVYYEDVNVWVYTRAFAERFGMPEKWIDENLKGAEAVAYRRVVGETRSHFPHKGPDVWMDDERCYMDLYIKDTVELPWLTDRMAEFSSVGHSFYYLTPQSRKDHEWVMRSLGMFSRHVPGAVSGGVGDVKSGDLWIMAYDRQVYPGLMYISINRSCAGAMEDGTSWIRFNRLDDLKNPKKVLGVMHQVELPASFHRRIYAYWKARRGDPAKLWGRILSGRPAKDECGQATP